MGNSPESIHFETRVILILILKSFVNTGPDVQVQVNYTFIF